MNTLRARDDALLLRARRMAQRSRAAAACAPCKANKSRCSDYRPCGRCKKLGTKLVCLDFPSIARPSQLSRCLHCMEDSEIHQQSNNNEKSLGISGSQISPGELDNKAWSTSCNGSVAHLQVQPPSAGRIDTSENRFHFRNPDGTMAAEHGCAALNFCDVDQYKVAQDGTEEAPWWGGGGEPDPRTSSAYKTSQVGPQGAGFNDFASSFTLLSHPSK
jgi:hypothetical protein